MDSISISSPQKHVRLIIFLEAGTRILSIEKYKIKQKITVTNNGYLLQSEYSHKHYYFPLPMVTPPLRFRVGLWDPSL